MSNNAAVRLAPLSVLDERGSPRLLGTLWPSNQVVLAFVRHFG